MTRLAQSHTVGNIIAQLTMKFPRHDMVGLYLACCAAILTSIVIARKDGIAPSAVSGRIAFLIAIGFTRGKSFALNRTILRLLFTVNGRKRLLAIVTRKNGLGSQSGIYERAGARPRAAFFWDTKILFGKCFVADGADGNLTSIAAVTTWIVGKKQLATILTSSLFRLPFCQQFHISIVPQIDTSAKLERFHEATGILPSRHQQPSTTPEGA